jgi:hypothetical protein
MIGQNKNQVAYRSVFMTIVIILLPAVIFVSLLVVPGMVLTENATDETLNVSVARHRSYDLSVSPEVAVPFALFFVIILTTLVCLWRINRRAFGSWVVIHHLLGKSRGPPWLFGRGYLFNF